ncbi:MULTISPECIES: hypothetical protein [unclassified Streptomyces]|jgi:hypothetical protein|uniref:hypothetical protein n=1 Tax=unclassified Streptomyces TaxID=2593676 RepID=UPI00117C401D|nr:hypothetical protein [Streptomyces sp. IB201691-2A2]TRO60206.1 hypothetical protein E4K73_31370 [Streptomyces sp. IB201691-2A2]
MRRLLTRRGQRAVRSGLSLTAAALLLSSCGIPSTGVVEAGEPATGIRPAYVLYFVRQDTLLGVRSQVPGTFDIGTAVELLFRGPDALLGRKALTTELPRLTSPVTLRASGARVSVTLPPGTEPLSGTALAQLTCTIADARLVVSAGSGSEGGGGSWSGNDTASSTKVTVTIPGVRQAEGSGEMCPGSATAE